MALVPEPFHMRSIQLSFFYIFNSAYLVFDFRASSHASNISLNGHVDEVEGTILYVHHPTITLMQNFQTCHTLLNKSFLELK
jgi:hypothetical protein